MKEFKAIVFKTHKGQFALPLLIPASNRAAYYAKKEEDHVKSYLTELLWVMEDDFEGIDWLLNNMNFVDVEQFCVQLDSKAYMAEDDTWTDSENFSITDFKQA